MAPEIIIVLLIILLIAGFVAIFLVARFQDYSIKIPGIKTYINKKSVKPSDDELMEVLNKYNSLKYEIEQRENIDKLIRQKIKGVRIFKMKDFQSWKTRLDDNKKALINQQNNIKTINFKGMCVDDKVNKESLFKFYTFFDIRRVTGDLNNLLANGKGILDSNHIVFFEDSILKLNENITIIEKINFDEIKFESKIKTKTSSKYNENDEVISTSWTHVTKKGLPDKRYNYNPKVYVINRYIVIVHFGNKNVEIELRRKAELESFEQIFEEIIKMNKKDVHREDKSSNVETNNDSKISNTFNKKYSHKVFGEGVILEKNEQYTTIDFNGTIRKISNSYIENEENTSIKENTKQNGEVVWHILFGEGIVINQNEKAYNIKFFKDGIIRDVSKEYKFQSPVESIGKKDRPLRKISHRIFGVGVIIKEDKYFYYVDFGGNGNKTLSKGYLNKSYFLGENTIPGTGEKSKTNKISSIIEENDIINHDRFGVGIVIQTSGEIIKVLFSDGNVVSINSKRKYYSLLPVDYNLVNNDATIFDVIYTQEKGYGSIIDIDEDRIFIIWNNGGLCDYDKRILRTVNLIKKENYHSICEGDIVIDQFKKIGVVRRIDDKDADVYFEDSTSKVKEIKDLSLLDEKSKGNLLINENMSDEMKFAIASNRDYSSIEDAIKLCNEYLNIKLKESVIKEFIKIGYRFKENVLLKNKFYSFEDYLNFETITIDVYRKDYIEIESYDTILRRMCANYLMIQHSENIYFTIKKLYKLGIRYTDILKFVESLKEYLQVNKYISLSKIKELIVCNVTQELSETMIDNLVNVNNVIKSREIGGKIVYQIRDYSTKKDSIASLIANEITSCGEKSKDIYDLIDLVNEKYDFEFDYYDFVDLLKTINNDKIYYSEEMDKIYLDKKDYYLEVYGDEK